ncbi:hypothetical protein Rumeso_03391 [Rubellimicrobium mesophilum DSM 19309]|uniref:Uncharacterized protein n=1 Tax=Rubellimicrobium mesophilum DSM 19309 TaxID=442562 RepID=A0A017HLQ7_9RHOB|nr:hypothetical protein Rumeso_03391 [Rubellimicrobium mesophilum DSM 19309]
MAGVASWRPRRRVPGRRRKGGCGTSMIGCALIAAACGTGASDCPQAGRDICAKTCRSGGAGVTPQAPPSPGPTRAGPSTPWEAGRRPRSGPRGAAYFPE